MSCRLIALCIVCLTAPSLAAQSPPVQFNRDVRPILSEKCFACHGPDEAERQADLRLDDRDVATLVGSPQPAIVPGRPSDSGLIQRIKSSDESMRMPPSETGETLTQSEIKLLERWIAQGAKYQLHWAFLPLAELSPPNVRQIEAPADADFALPDGWPKNGIDHFIASELKQRGLSPSRPADKSTLIRRVSLDLTGLLPTPEHVRQFLNDQSEAAYERLVDRLLESPHYGERWGRHWLDQARYADSNGYTIDGERVMWPYRDWVIQALNTDMPFDQFTIEQLAGDLLPGATKEQRIATGFHRNTLINQEGGTDPEQFRIEAVMDRVDTTGAVWLGLTIGCAQCHSHKFDPITQREYYEMFAFFNHDADVNNVGPTEEVHEGELFLMDGQAPELSRLRKAVAEVERLEKTASERQAAWEATLLADTRHQPTPDQIAWHVVRPSDAVAEEATLTTLEDQSILATQGVLREIYVVETVPLPHDAVLGSFQWRVIPHDSLPQNGPGLAANGNFVLSTIEVYLLGESEAEQLPLVSASATHAQPGYPVGALIDQDPGTGWAINVGDDATVKMNAEHQAWLTLGRAVDAGGKRLKIVLKHELNNHYNVGRFQLAWSEEVAEATASPKFQDALRTPPEKRRADQRRMVRTAFAAVDQPYKNARAHVDRLRRKMGLGPIGESMVMQMRSKRRDTYVLTRGDFLRPDKQQGVVRPDTPDVLPAMPKTSSKAQRDRLDLAQWLVSPDHPLTPRVTVNRIWMRYFGRGIVDTENDFGAQGSPPTHPQLLDWLARQFIDSGWSQKELHRLIVTSATYRQTSHIATRQASEAQQIDPQNRWLWRQNRLRLDAEIVRDVALSASGRLNPTLGGPSVQPPQPAGVYAFTQNRKNWQTDTGADRYRRALYTMFYRSAPYPMLTTFDAPDFQSVCTSRTRSNTPLQALTMANDKAFVEMARGLADRILTSSFSDHSPRSDGAREDGDSARIEQLFYIAYCRPPQPAERRAVQQFVNDQQSHFLEDTIDARRIVGQGDQADDADATLPDERLARRAAWTAVARAIMNTDEFITRE